MGPVARTGKDDTIIGERGIVGIEVPNHSESCLYGNLTCRHAAEVFVAHEFGSQDQACPLCIAHWFFVQPQGYILTTRKS